MASFGARVLQVCSRLTGVFVGKRETLALTHRKYHVTVVVFGCGSQAKGLWPPLQAERRRGERFLPEV